MRIISTVINGTILQMAQNIYTLTLLLPLSDWKHLKAIEPSINFPQARFLEKETYSEAKKIIKSLKSSVFVNVSSYFKVL